MTARIAPDGKFRPDRRAVDAGKAGTPPPSVTSLDEAPFERGDEVELARRMLRKLRAGTEGLLLLDGEVRRYQAGVYERVGPDELVTSVCSFAGTGVVGSSRTVRVSEAAARGAVRLARSFLAVEEGGRRSSEEAPAGVATRSGFLRLETTAEGTVARVDPPSPSQLATFALPFEYDPGAPRPRLERFLAEVFADATDGDEVRRAGLLQEFLGACLFGDAPSYQQCLILWGREGGNGKSQFLEICKAIFPPDSIASLPPQAWGERFALAQLVAKRINLVAEIPERDISSSDVFKAVVDGETLSIEDKYKDRVFSRLRAGHVFNVNKLPRSSDVTPAFFRRILVCPFESDMRLAETTVVDLGRSIARTEGPGILAWAVEGAVRRRSRSSYTESSRGRFVLRSWRTDYDPLLAFLASIEPGTDLSGSALHETCLSNGLTTKGPRSFGMFLKELSDPEDPSRMFDCSRSDGIWYRRRG